MKKIALLILIIVMVVQVSGCTSEGIEKAKDIEGTKNYLYTKPTGYYLETPTETETPIEFKKGTIEFLKMNEPFKYFDSVVTVKEAILSTNYNKIYELTDEELAKDVVKEFAKLKNAFKENGESKIEDESFLWVKVNFKYEGTKKNNYYLTTAVFEQVDDKYRVIGGMLFFDRETWLHDPNERMGNQLVLSPGDDVDVWLCMVLGGYNADTKYFLKGSFSNIYPHPKYTGYLIELEIKQ